MRLILTKICFLLFSVGTMFGQIELTVTTTEDDVAGSLRDVVEQIMASKESNFRILFDSSIYGDTIKLTREIYFYYDNANDRGVQPSIEMIVPEAENVVVSVNYEKASLPILSGLFVMESGMTLGLNNISFWGKSTVESFARVLKIDVNEAEVGFRTANVSILNCDFTGGQVVGTIEEDGGAIWVNGNRTEPSRLEIRNSEFINTLAKSGGAIYFDAGELIVDDCLFEGCRFYGIEDLYGTEGLVGGGAIFTRYTENSVISNSEFKANKHFTGDNRGAGGAILDFPNNPTGESFVSGNTFTQNSGDQGAVLMAVTDRGTVNFFNNYCYKNTGNVLLGFEGGTKNFAHNSFVYNEMNNGNGAIIETQAESSMDGMVANNLFLNGSFTNVYAANGTADGLPFVGNKLDNGQSTDLLVQNQLDAIVGGNIGIIPLGDGSIYYAISYDEKTVLGSGNGSITSAIPVLGNDFYGASRDLLNPDPGAIETPSVIIENSQSNDYCENDLFMLRVIHGEESSSFDLEIKTFDLDDNEIASETFTITSNYQSIDVGSKGVGEYVLKPYVGGVEVLTTQLELEVNPLPAFSPIADVSLSCSGDRATFDYSSAPETFSFMWMTSDVGEEPSFGRTVSFGGGDYHVRVEENGCAIEDDFSVFEPAAFIGGLDSVYNETCIGNVDGRVKLKAQGGTVPYTFVLWNDQDSIPQADSVFTNLGHNDFFLTVIDDNGCWIFPSEGPDIPNREFAEGEISELTQGEFTVGETSEFPPFQIVSRVTIDYNFEIPVMPDLGDDIDTCLNEFDIRLLNQLPQDEEITWTINRTGNVQTQEDATVVNVSNFDQGSNIEIIAENNNILDDGTSCPSRDTLIVSYDRANVPSVTSDPVDDICVNGSPTPFMTTASGLGNVSFSELGWRISNESVTDTIWLSGLLDAYSFATYGTGLYDVAGIVAFDDECTAALDTAFLLTPEAQMTVYDSPVFDFTQGNTFDVAAGDVATIIPFNLDGFEEYYDFTITIDGSINEGSGSFSTNGQEVVFTSDKYDFEQATVNVTIYESRCFYYSIPSPIIVNVINTSPVVIDKDVTLVQGDTLTISLLDLINDGEDNIVRDSLVEISINTASVEIIREDGSLFLDYSNYPEFIGEETVEIKVCDPQSCEVIEVNISVVPDFYVNSLDTTLSQGTDFIVDLDTVTNATGYTVRIEGPFTEELQALLEDEPEALVVDTIEKTLSLSLTVLEDFVGVDSIMYVICEGTNCDSAVLNIRVLAYDKFVDPNQLRVEMYNVLSPNGDGKHEFLKYQFQVGEDGELFFSSESELLIFNRAGEIVYSNENYDWTDEENRFTGRYKDTDKLLPVGTYFYTVNLDGGWGKVEEKGFIQLKY